MDIVETATRILAQGSATGLGAEMVVGQTGYYGANDMFVGAVEPMLISERVDEGVAEFVPDDL